MDNQEVDSTEKKLVIERYGGWTLIVIFSIIPILRALMIPEFTARLGTSYGILSAIAKLAGTAGFVLYGINLVLSIRKRWLERYFSGLNKVYIAHHITGGIALILLTMHPLFLALRYIVFGSWVTLKDAAEFLLPRTISMTQTFDVVNQQMAINNGFIAFGGMVVLLVLTFFIKLPYRVWLFTHKFLGPAFFFATLHVIFISSSTSSDWFLKAYLSLWGVIGLVAFTYRTLFGSIFVRSHPFQVSRVLKLPKDTIAIDLTPIEDDVPFKAGQFVFVRFLWRKEQGILPEVHPFSIASAPSEGVVRLIVKSLGDFTKSLMNLPEGTVAEVEGAFGKFDYTRHITSPQIWIGGGIGITPFMGMASTLTTDSPQVTLFYSVVNRQELIGQELFGSFVPKQSPKFTYVPFVTDETKTFINADFIAEKAGGLDGKEIFICGPPVMMKSLRKQLKAKGVPARRIHSEEFAMS